MNGHLLCLCCGNTVENGLGLTACPSCECGEHVPADLDDTVTITLTKHELRILTFWAANYAHGLGHPHPAAAMKTIGERLATQVEVALSLSQDIADLQAAFPDAKVTVHRDGRVVEP